MIHPLICALFENDKRNVRIVSSQSDCVWVRAEFLEEILTNGVHSCINHFALMNLEFEMQEAGL